MTTDVKPKEMATMKALMLLAITMVELGCGPDKGLLMETKLDAPLRQKMASIQEGTTEPLSVFGKCTGTIDGPMRQALVGAGADVRTMNGDIFTASISSGDILSVAALEFVTQIQLSQESKILPK